MPFVLKRSLANLPFEFRQFRWGKGFGHVIADISNRGHIREKAVEFSEILTEYRDRNPGQMIYVVAKSAGTGVALMALSEVQPNTVDRAILLSSAVSPQF